MSERIYNGFMKKEVANKIHKAADEFRKAIQEGTGCKRTLVMWSAYDEVTMPSGVILGEELSTKDLALMLFKLTGRAYYLIENTINN